MVTSISDSIFVECPVCKRRRLTGYWKKNMYVCDTCGKYLPMSAKHRLLNLLDRDDEIELNSDLESQNPLDFPGYEDKLRNQQLKTGLSEAVVTVVGKIGGIKTVCIVLDSKFMMGSMSSVVGERITRGIEYATDNKLPLIIFSASGGARVQEGIYSLIQMAKTADAIEEFSRSGGLYISYLTHPTMGGVTASFAMLGDIILAEPGALIGFAGPRVIEQTIGKKLPPNFQRAEYLESHGFIDKIVERKEMRSTLIDLLYLHCDHRKEKGSMFVIKM